MPKLSAIAVSLIAHVGIAAAAAHHAELHPSTGSGPPLEIPAPELERADGTSSDQQPPADAAVSVHASEPRSAVTRVRAREPVANVPEPAATTAERPTAAPDVSASADASPHFVMTVAPSATLSSGLTSAPATGIQTNAALEAPAPVQESAVQTPARLQAGNAPSYTAAALSAGIEADVPLEIVVSEAGTVQSARGVEHVGYGLDEAALQAVRNYRFTPALRGGKAVPVRMHWLMRFQLR
jgi:protein TonB